MKSPLVVWPGGCDAPFEGQGWGLEIPRLAPMGPKCSILVIKPGAVSLLFSELCFGPGCVLHIWGLWI
jgi:hypothetical protein